MRAAPLVAILSLAACVGEIDEGSPTDQADGQPGGAPGPTALGGASAPAGIPGAPAPAAGATPGAASGATGFACSAAAAPAGQAWRRLSPDEYRNTLQDLIAFALRDARAAATVAGALPLASLPDRAGGLHGKFERMEQEVQDDHVRAWYEIALAAGRALAARERIGVAVGPCATDASADNDAACLTDFVRRFGERAFRRPLTDQEVAAHLGFHGGSPGVDPAGVADVIAGLLLAPPFLYLSEHGEAAVPGKANVFRLSPYELAARLSYHFWETMPDQPLWDAARSGALATAEGFARELDRMLRDPRTRRTTRTFFAEWLRLEELPPLGTYNADPLFKAFAGADLPRSSLRASMIQEVLDMFDHLVWEKAGSFDDLLLNDRVYPRTPELARLYGVEPWQPGAEPPAAPAGERPGFLTRAALLASGTANTRPILRGAFVRTGVLCDEVPPPPSGDAPPPPALSDKATTRQTVEALTEAKGSACAACHSTLINPLGFALEGFDALGRTRAEQRLFSRDGKEVGRAPVDSASVPQVVLGDARPSRGAADLARQIVESGKASACLARNYFRFAHARQEDLGRDGCGVERVRAALTGGAPVREALRAVATGPEFRERTF